MGEVLRPREGERPHSEARTAHRSPAITPERQPLVAPDTHHAQPCWTGFAGWAKTPLSESRRTCRPLCSVGTQGIPRPDWLSGYGKGPSVADRGAFSPPAQGASLLGSNGRITEQRPAGLGRRRWVANRGRAKQLIDGQNPTDQRPWLTGSNSGRDCQVLAKRGRSDLPTTGLSLGHHTPGRLATGQNRPRAPLGGRPQNRARDSALRAAETRGSSAPTTSKSSRSRSRTVSRSSPAVRRTVSMSRPNASST
ncbi:hypothetical protein M2164_002868 [Streptomyces sp. SAI-208]|nr:hypothetical protein [Streptomyces sp. SAI-117]MDH6607233.1 hypothetical protein [Streptomyces sp. SAI-208]